MERGGEGVLSEIRKSEERGESDSPHPPAKRPFLSVETVRPDALVSEKMERLVFDGIVGFLKDRHVVGAAFVEICVFVGIDRIDFQSDVSEILTRKSAGFSDIFDVAFLPALAGQDQDFFHTAVGDDLHFMLDLLEGQLHAANRIVTVEAAVNAVVAAVIGDIQRCEQIDRIAEMTSGITLGAFRHLFENGFCGGREQRLEVVDAADGGRQRSSDIPRRIGRIVVGIHL